MWRAALIASSTSLDERSLAESLDPKRPLQQVPLPSSVFVPPFGAPLSATTSASEVRFPPRAFQVPSTAVWS